MPDDKDGSLAGFALTLSGETEDEFAVPTGLQLPGLGEAVSMRLNADKFTVPKGLLQSTFKCAQRLVKSDNLIFLGSEQAGSPGTSSRPLETPSTEASDHEEQGQQAGSVSPSFHRVSA